jgi:prepilin-type N-terminal cleavage/methylation domain-containing protein
MGDRGPFKAAGRTMMKIARHEGFTLFELLVVVAIIGILAAIAIPAFSAYRADGYNAHAATGLNTLAKAEESYFATNGRYTTDIAQLPPYNPPNGVVLRITGVTVQEFQAEGYHPLGTKTFQWDSGAGGLKP